MNNGLRIPHMVHDKTFTPSCQILYSGSGSDQKQKREGRETAFLPWMGGKPSIPWENGAKGNAIYFPVSQAMRDTAERGVQGKHGAKGEFG